MFKVTTDFSALKRMQEKLGSIAGTHTVPMKDLFTPSFMHEHTSFGTLDEMFAASGFKCDTTEDFRAIPDAEWDAFVRRTTQFGSWADMIRAGANRWTKEQITK